MPAIVEVIGGLVVLVAALLAVDWFTAGRLKGRRLVSARNQNAQNAGVGYAQIDTQGHSDTHPGGTMGDPSRHPTTTRHRAE
jgi:hypothetical protein